jgi:hypothetical protein
MIMITNLKWFSNLASSLNYQKQTNFPHQYCLKTKDKQIGISKIIKEE